MGELRAHREPIQGGLSALKQWVNIRKLSVVVAQYILATKYNATVATVFILFVQVISLMLIYRLEPYDDMNGNISNQATACCPTTRSRKLHDPDSSARSCSGPPFGAAVRNLAHGAVRRPGAAGRLLPAGGHVEHRRARGHLWHTSSRTSGRWSTSSSRSSARPLRPLVRSRQQTDQRARDAAAAAAADAWSASASSATRRLIGEQRRRETRCCFAWGEHEGAQQRRMQKVISQMSQLLPGGGMRRDNSSVVSFFSMATRRRESNQERRTG